MSDPISGQDLPTGGRRKPGPVILTKSGMNEPSAVTLD